MAITPARGETASVRPLPYSSIGAEIPFYALLGTFLVCEQRTRIRSLLNREGMRADHGSFFAAVLAIGAGVGGGFVLASDLGTGFIGGDSRWPLFIVGLVLMAAGIALRQWAIYLLGAFFTVDVRVQEGQTVIDRGPYGWVCHPSYTGMLLTFAGIGLALDDWLSLLCVVLVPLAGLLVRIRVEEDALLRELGEPYRRYAEGRARLIPRVW